jgi:hypothetical protein
MKSYLKALIATLACIAALGLGHDSHAADLTKIELVNLTNQQLSVNVQFERGRVLRRTIPVAGRVDVADACTIDEINRSVTFQRLRGLVSGYTAKIRVDYTVGADDVKPAINPAPIIHRMHKGKFILNSLSGSAAQTMTLTGSNLLQNKVQAAATIAGTSTGRLILTANRPGTPGNLISLTVSDDGGGGATYTTSGNSITIDLGGATVSVGTAASAINAALTSNGPGLLVHATSTGSGNLVATAATYLSGGTGQGVAAYVDGAEVGVRTLMTDTEVQIYVDSLNGAVAGDIVGISVLTDGAMTNTLTSTVTAT